MKINLQTVISYLLPFVKAVLIFVVGHYLVKWFSKIPEHALGRTKLDKSLINIIVKTVLFAGNFVVFLSSLSALGISTTGLLASLSAVAVALVIALKDSLSSLVGGVFLLAVPRFSTGDYIKIDGEEGFVDEIHLLHTTIRTYDNRHVTYSNGNIINSTVMNYTWEGKHRIDLVFPIPYSADCENAKALATEVVNAHALVLPESEGTRYIRVGEYGDSAVKLHVYVWVKREDYLNVYYDLTEQIRKKLSENGIDVPFNQLDVHLDKADK